MKRVWVKKIGAAKLNLMLYPSCNHYNRIKAIKAYNCPIVPVIAHYVQYPQEGLKFFSANPGFASMIFSEDSVTVKFYSSTLELFSVYIPLE